MTELSTPRAIANRLATVWLLRKRWRSWWRPGHKVGAGDTATIPASKAQKAFFELEKELAILGLARAPGETPRNWLRRVDRDGGNALDQERLTSARELVDALYRRRYAST